MATTVKLIEKKECTGCYACKNICPTGCICLRMDEEGFAYPEIEQNKCISCGQCYGVCTARRAAGLVERHSSVRLAYAMNLQVVSASSSGGLFATVAIFFLEQEGIVYGAALESMRVRHVRISTEKDLHKILKSKYLASDVGDSFQQVRDDLAAGKKVLFSGTPCQISGLYAFLGGDNDNLYTCDVVCHGVPSRRVFDKFVCYEEKKYNAKMVSMTWRDKRRGWHRNSIVECFDNGREVDKLSYEHSFQRGFLDNLYLRPSCYECKFAGIPRVADISLADGWNAERHHKKFAERNNDRGLSFVITSSSKGETVFEMIEDKCVYEAVTIEEVKECSRHVYKPPLMNARRNDFFEDINKSYKYLMKKYIYADDPKVKWLLKCKIVIKSFFEKVGKQ